MPAIDLANPTRFLAFSGRLLPWLWAVTAIVLTMAWRFGRLGRAAERRPVEAAA